MSSGRVSSSHAIRVGANAWHSLNQSKCGDLYGTYILCSPILRVVIACCSLVDVGFGFEGVHNLSMMRDNPTVARSASWKLMYANEPSLIVCQSDSQDPYMPRARLQNAPNRISRIRAAHWPHGHAMDRPVRLHRQRGTPPDCRHLDVAHCSHDRRCTYGKTNVPPMLYVCNRIWDFGGSHVAFALHN